MARIHTRWSATCSVAGATKRLPSTWRWSMARSSAMCRAPGWSTPAKTSASDGTDIGSGTHRHRVLVVEPAVGGLERRAHRQDRLAVLDGVHPAGRERPAVAHPLHAEGDRLGVVAGTHEVGVDASAAGGRRRPSTARTVRPHATTPWASTWPPNTRPCGCFWLCPRNRVMSSAKVSGSGTGASPARAPAVESAARSPGPSPAPRGRGSRGGRGGGRAGRWSPGQR